MCSRATLFFCLCLAVCEAADLILECNNSCKEFEKQQSVGGFSCNIAKNQAETDENLIAAASPTLENANWYIHRKEGISHLAINVTWSIPGAVAAKAYQHAYQLQVTVGFASTSQTFEISMGNYSRKSLRAYDKVIFNHACIGVSTEVLFADKTYVVMLSGIPSNVESSPSFKLINIPGCDNHKFNVSQTQSCRFDEAPKISTTTEMQHTTSSIVMVHVESMGNAIKVPLAIGVPSVILILIMAVLCYHKRKAEGLHKNILILSNGVTGLSSPDMTKMTDQLLNDLKKLGCNVVYSLWHETSISALGCPDWLHRQLKVADCVIFLFPSTKYAKSAPDMDPLINPFDVGLKILQKNILLDVGPLVLAVHFNKKPPINLPDIFSKANVFSYPKQSFGLISKIEKCTLNNV